MTTNNANEGDFFVNSFFVGGQTLSQYISNISYTLTPDLVNEATALYQTIPGGVVQQATTAIAEGEHLCGLSA